MKYLIRNDIANSDAVEELQSLLEYYTQFQVEIINLEDQRNDWHHWLQSNRSISLDKRIAGQYNLQISRLFLSYADGDEQTIPQKLIPSPETGETFSEQLSKIPQNNSYVLFDDDSASGTTIQTTIALLKRNNIYIKKIVTANPFTDFIDIIDASDFIDSAQNNGGLVVAHDDIVQRQNYLSPHVNLETRAKLPNTLKSILNNTFVGV